MQKFRDLFFQLCKREFWLIQCITKIKLVFLKSACIHKVSNQFFSFRLFAPVAGLIKTHLSIFHSRSYFLFQFLLIENSSVWYWAAIQKSLILAYLFRTENTRGKLNVYQYRKLDWFYNALCFVALFIKLDFNVFYCLSLCRTIFFKTIIILGICRFSSTLVSQPSLDI